MASLNAVSPWEPNATHEHHHFSFIKSIAMGIPDHMDIFPLAMRTLKEGMSKSLLETQEFAVIHRLVCHKALSVGAELELRMAGLCMYGTGTSSPVEFMELLTAIYGDRYHQLRVEPPLEDAQDRISRMHRLAGRCAHLLGEQGRDEDAEKVLDLVKKVYNDGYLAYQRWNHPRDEASL